MSNEYNRPEAVRDIYRDKAAVKARSARSFSDCVMKSTRFTSNLKMKLTVTRTCFVRAALAVASAILLSGCLGIGHVYWPDQARLSRTSRASDAWGEHSIYEQKASGANLVRFHFHADDVIVSGKNVVFDDGANYWIQIKAFTEGRKSFVPNFDLPGVGVPTPIIYSSEGAYIDMGDGRKVHADLKVYLADKKNPEVPSKDYLYSPANLNSDEVHSRSRDRSISAYKNAYLRFPVRPPAVGSAWVVHLGSVKLGHETVALPEYGLRLYEGRDEYYRYKGAW